MPTLTKAKTSHPRRLAGDFSRRVPFSLPPQCLCVSVPQCLCIPTPLHPSFPPSRNFFLCAKKRPKTMKGGGAEPEDLREIRHFLRSNLNIFAYFLQKPPAEPEYLRLALSKTRFQILISDHWPPTTDY